MKLIFPTNQVAELARILSTKFIPNIFRLSVIIAWWLLLEY
jgi:hypothetical protein